jgi:hypothetical protein
MIDLFSKESINYSIIIFIMIIIILLMCFSSYYIIPNNYLLYNNKLISNVKPLKTINIKLNKNSKYTINSNVIDNLNNLSIQIETESKNYPIKILLSNFLKSQNLYVVEDTLFQSQNNSCITIVNDSDKSISFNINFFSIEDVLLNN